jgi:hypothetical protein
MYLTAFAILCPLLALLTHEMTHCYSETARHGPVSFKLLSVFPMFRLHISVPGEESKRGTRLIAAAPLIFEVAIAVVSMGSGLWYQIQLSVSYYIEGILILSWAAYSHLSPADVRMILDPSPKPVT